MLFDLRSRGRRRVIKVVYGSLAVLMAGGLVLFGVGGGAGSTGLLSQLAQQGSGSSSGIKLDETTMLKAQRTAKAQPNSVAAWDRYALAVYTLADTNYDTSVDRFTSAGYKELLILKSAWNHYLALSPANPDQSLAGDVSFAFGQNGIQEWKTAEGAAEVVATANPKSYSDYTYLALYAYLAKDKASGHLAEDHALAVAPKSERSQITSFLAGYGGPSGPTGTTGTSGSSSSTGTSGKTSSSGSTGTSAKKGSTGKTGASG